MKRAVIAFVAFFLVMTVVALGIGFAGVQGSFFGSTACDWQPVMNGSYSSVDEFRADFQGDFSKVQEQTEFRVRDGVLQYRSENQEACLEAGSRS
jgi:hypothetical protein